MRGKGPTNDNCCVNNAVTSHFIFWKSGRNAKESKGLHLRGF